MAKFEVREIRLKLRDPRAEQTSSGDDEPASARRPQPSTVPTSAVPSSPADLMRQLGGSPRGPGPSDDDREADLTPAPLDIFGIVGTTQAEVFRVESIVAHGGFSAIYKAKHLRFDAPVALKCLKVPPTLTGKERNDFLASFKKEGELMFRLSSSCPEIVRPVALDAFRLEQGQLVPFIALEWLEGATLKDTIVERILASKKPLSLRRAVSLLTPVARALVRAHNFPSPEGRLAILHCDLKPDNIFVANQDGGQVLKIFDFGIAKVRMAATREAGAATATTGRNMFTPAYAAPELWSPDQYGQTGPWTDLFALALTLTEIVTQKPALQGSAASMLTQCLDASKRPTPRALGLDVSDRIEAIFQRALAVDPRERARTVEELWSDLEDALDLPRSIAQGRSSLPFIAMPVSWDDPEEGDEPGEQEDAKSFDARSSKTVPEPRTKSVAPPPTPERSLESVPAIEPGSAPLSVPPSVVAKSRLSVGWWVVVGCVVVAGLTALAFFR